VAASVAYPAGSAILPGMAQKPDIAIVGAGNLATALALALRKAGYRIEAIVSRKEGSLRAKRLAKRFGTRVVVNPKTLAAKILWLCVPDGEIARAASTLAQVFAGRGKIALHSSGALTSDELRSLRRKGTEVASVHPLMTFVRNSAPSLAGIPFAIEGDSKAVRAARSIVRDLGGEAYRIRKKEKNAYHTWGTFASPLLTALLATTEHVAGLAGVKAKAARRRMLPILLRTIENYARLGAGKGFSGPIIRGDVETVRRHLEVLRRAPIPKQVYLALARAAMEYLPVSNRKPLERLLTSA
jgi:predicted short-subunit dehydrogenase-like oxidoreductase (DUF2520 family)